jgi:phosphoglycerol transferase MdoB-like AlkP superfamily enzyme
MGHTTLAIHPFMASMYQRERVYPILGFSDFKDRTKMDYRGRVEDNPYISDRAAFRQTLDAIDSHDEPVFVNLVTMQNHMPYRGKYADPIGVRGLDERDAELMSYYSRGLSYSDQAMSELIQQLNRSHEKTIIVFYGDHVPGGTPRALFKKNTRLAMHQTPFFMYANFGQVKPKEFPTTSPIYFLPNLFDMAKAPLPPYYMLLRQMQRHISAIEHGTMRSPEDKRLSPKTLSPEAREVLEDYKLVVYDLSVGKRYAERMLYPTPAGTVAASGTPE